MPLPKQKFTFSYQPFDAQLYFWQATGLTVFAWFWFVLLIPRRIKPEVAYLMGFAEGGGGIYADWPIYDKPQYLHLMRNSLYSAKWMCIPSLWFSWIPLFTRNANSLFVDWLGVLVEVPRPWLPEDAYDWGYVDGQNFADGRAVTNKQVGAVTADLDARQAAAAT